MKRVLAYITVMIVSAFAFNGIAEGVRYIAENGMTVTLVSDCLDSADCTMAMCEATLTSPVTVPDTTTYAVKHLSAPVVAIIAVMALLLPLFSFSETLLANASISEERHKILFPFHSFW
jgi:hypothetical protein